MKGHSDNQDNEFKKIRRPKQNQNQKKDEPSVNSHQRSSKNTSKDDHKGDGKFHIPKEKDDNEPANHRRKREYHKTHNDQSDEGASNYRERSKQYNKDRDYNDNESNEYRGRRSYNKRVRDQDDNTPNDYKEKRKYYGKERESNDFDSNNHRGRRDYDKRIRDQEDNYKERKGYNEYKEKYSHQRKEDNDNDSKNYQYKKDKDYIDHPVSKKCYARKEKLYNKESSKEFTTQIQVKDFALNDFFITLVDAYLNNPKYDKLFNSCEGSKLDVSIIEDQTILSYSPNSKKATELMNRAIECAETLMPFTPKTILYHNDYPNCAIEVTVNGCMKYFTTLHLINKNNKNLPKVFNINSEMIEFLCTKVDELSSSMNLYRIALTGESLSFSLDGNHTDVKYKKISFSNCPTVFGKKFDDKNRLIVLISPDEAFPTNQTELDWLVQNLSPQEESIQTAASLAKGLVRAYHAHDLFVIKESPEFTYTGPTNTFQTLGLGRNSTINQICEVLYKDYTRGTFLQKEIPVKNLKYNENMKISGDSIDDELRSLFEKVKKINIQQLKKEKDKLFKELDSLGPNPDAKKKNLIGSKLTAVKKSINDSYEMNKRIDVLKEKKEKSDNDRKIIMKRVEQQGYRGMLINLFGCNVFSSSEPISSSENDDEEEKLKKFLLQIERDQKINVFCVEKLVSATVVVSHRSTSPFSPEQFQRTIETVCTKFSFIVFSCSSYIPQKRGGEIGVVFVEVIDSQFAIIVVSEIKRALLGQQSSVLRIPAALASKMMLREKKNQETIEKWIKKNKLMSIKFNGENWSGSRKDVSKANSLIGKSDTCIVFSQKVLLLPPSVDRREVKNIQKSSKNGAWFYDHLSDCIVYEESSEKVVSQILAQLKKSPAKATKADDNDGELNGCIYVCEKQVPSAFPLTIYNKDGSYKTNFLCSECITSTLDSITSAFLDEGGIIDFDALMSSENLIDMLSIAYEDEDFWPKVPLGQLLWNLANDPLFSEKAKAWLTAVIAQSLHVHPEVVTFCPEHPQVILPLPRANEDLHCSIKNCPMILCRVCNQWHREGDCKNYKWEGMRCPGCGKPTVKDIGCNHITCLCGAHWCYKCGAGPFKTSKECYDHMSKEHSGYFD